MKADRLQASERPIYTQPRVKTRGKASYIPYSTSERCTRISSMFFIDAPLRGALMDNVAYTPRLKPGAVYRYASPRHPKFLIRI